MSVQTQARTLLHTLVRGIQTSVKYLSDGVLRIFKAADDDYPATGVQPFEGDIPDPKRHFG